MSRSVLFITYDGLLDPLGGSQILPYLRDIALHPRPVHILSFEKADRFKSGEKAMRESLARDGIEWTPLSFTTRAGKLGKAWDLARMYLVAIYLALRHQFGFIHCRSYQAMQVGCLLRRITRARTIFDMRGLWVDERVDGGLWDTSRLRDALAFRLYKWIERRLLGCANHVVALTDKVVPELHRLSPRMRAPVTVIPCCADFDHFRPLSLDERGVARARLGLPKDALVISYLGSLGTWYMLEEMLAFFSRAAAGRQDVHLLLITRDWRPEHEGMVRQMGLDELRSRMHVHPATRDEVRHFLGCSDVMLSFIKPAYSKMASSPTKLAEAFALGVPAISNVGIGDVDGMTLALRAGALVDFSRPETIDNVIGQMPSIREEGGAELRERARREFGLEVAKARYRSVYESLEANS